MRKKLLEELKKVFEEQEIKIIDLKKTIFYKDKKMKTQTLEVDGRQIEMIWAPPVKKLKESLVMEVLLKDCIIKIQILLNDGKEKEGKLI